MKRKLSSLGLLLMTLFLVIGSVNSFASESTNTAPETNQFANGKYVVDGNIERVNIDQIQLFSGEESAVRVPYVMENVEYYVVQSTKKEDGQYYFDYVLTTNNERVVAAPIKYNQSEQTLLIKVGTASKDIDPVITDGKDRASATSSVTNAPEKNASLKGIVQPLAFTTKSGSFQTVWEDPINLNVNSVKDNITFSYDGSTVNYISGSDNRTWLTASGWYEKSHSISSFYTGSVNITVATNNVFQNDIFCAGQTTNTNYSPNAVTGTYIGNISGQISTNATGGCSSWLDFYNVLDT